MEIREVFDLLEKLYEINVLGLSRLARTLGISYNKLYVFINTLKRMEFEIVPCFNLRLLRLGMLFAISSNENFIEECKPLFPKDYFALLIVPLDIEYKNMGSLLGSLTSIHKVYLIEEAQLPKHLLISYNVYDFNTLKKEKIWIKLVEKIDRASAQNLGEDINTSQQQYSGKHKIDHVDLKIMNELTYDPFISSRKLADKLKIPVGKVRRRIITRVERLMKGYRVLWAPYYKIFNAVLFTVIRPGSIPSKILYELFSEFPLTVLTAHNPGERIVINAWLLDNQSFVLLKKYLRILEQKYDIEVLDVWGYLYSGEERQIIPCKILVKYDKRTKGLVLMNPLSGTGQH